MFKVLSIVLEKTSNWLHWTSQLREREKERENLSGDKKCGSSCWISPPPPRTLQVNTIDMPPDWLRVRSVLWLAGSRDVTRESWAVGSRAECHGAVERDNSQHWVFQPANPDIQSPVFQPKIQMISISGPVVTTLWTGWVWVLVRFAASSVVRPVHQGSLPSSPSFHQNQPTPSRFVSETKPVVRPLVGRGGELLWEREISPNWVTFPPAEVENLHLSHLTVWLSSPLCKMGVFSTGFTYDFSLSAASHYSREQELQLGDLLGI